MFFNPERMQLGMYLFLVSLIISIIISFFIEKKMRKDKKFNLKSLGIIILIAIGLTAILFLVISLFWAAIVEGNAFS